VFFASDIFSVEVTQTQQDAFLKKLLWCFLMSHKRYFIAGDHVPSNIVLGYSMLGTLVGYVSIFSFM
jgi:hypothetical protein